MTNAKICCRDGEEKATLEFCGVRVEMGLTELRNLLSCAYMDFAKASGPVRQSLEKPVAQLLQLVDKLISVPRPPNPDADAANLKRYHETGLGGVVDMSEIEALLKN